MAPQIPLTSRLGKDTTAAHLALAIGICCATCLLMLIVLSSEVRRRIAIEFSMIEPEPSQYGAALHAAVAWQIRIVLLLGLIFLGSAAALALGIVARRAHTQTKVVATAGIYLSLLDLVGAIVLFWVIS